MPTKLGSIFKSKILFLSLFFLKDRKCGGIICKHEKENPVQVGVRSSRKVPKPVFMVSVEQNVLVKQCQLYLGLHDFR